MNTHNDNTELEAVPRRAGGTGSRAPGTASAATWPGAAERSGLIDVAFERHDTPLGTIVVGATRDGPRPHRPARARTRTTSCSSSPSASRRASCTPRASSLIQTRRELDEYFGHDRQASSIPLDWRLVERLPARGPARHGADPLRPHGLLPRRRDERGQPERGARRRLGARDQPAADRRPVPPRAAHRRRPRPVPGRPGGQGAAPDPRRRGLTVFHAGSRPRGRLDRDGLPGGGVALARGRCAPSRRSS